MWSSLKFNPSRMDPLPLVEDDKIYSMNSIPRRRKPLSRWCFSFSH